MRANGLFVRTVTVRDHTAERGAGRAVSPARKRSTLAAADRRIELLETMVREMAAITPRKGEWESS